MNICQFTPEHSPLNIQYMLDSPTPPGFCITWCIRLEICIESQFVWWLFIFTCLWGAFEFLYRELYFSLNNVLKCQILYKVFLWGFCWAVLENWCLDQPMPLEHPSPAVVMNVALSSLHPTWHYTFLCWQVVETDDSKRFSFLLDYCSAHNKTTRCPWLTVFCSIIWLRCDID